MIFFRTILLILIFWIQGCIYFFDEVSQIKNTKNHADAIIVLTGARGRIDAGLELLYKKSADKLFISGVGQKAALKDLSKFLSYFPGEEMLKLEHSIYLGHFASTTEENAVETAEWIKNNNISSIILVTSNYHMPRSLYLLQKTMPQITILPYTSSNDINFRMIFLEYNKYLLALFK